MFKQALAVLGAALILAPAARGEILTLETPFTFRVLEVRKLDTGSWTQGLLLGLLGELNKANRTEDVQKVKAALVANDFGEGKGLEAVVLKDAVVAFDRDLKDLRLSDLVGRKDFAGAIFVPGTNLGRMDFRKADFTGAILQGVDLSNCRLEGSDFTRAKLNESLLPKGLLDGGKVVVKDTVAPDGATEGSTSSVEESGKLVQVGSSRPWSSKGSKASQQELKQPTKDELGGIKLVSYWPNPGLNEGFSTVFKAKARIRELSLEGLGLGRPTGMAALPGNLLVAMEDGKSLVMLRKDGYRIMTFEETLGSLGSDGKSSFWVAFPKARKVITIEPTSVKGDFTFSSNIYYFDTCFPGGPNTLALQEVPDNPDGLLTCFDPSMATKLFFKVWGPKGLEKVLSLPSPLTSLHVRPGQLPVMVDKEFRCRTLGKGQDWIIPKQHRREFQVAESLKDEFTYLCAKGVFAQKQNKPVQLCEPSWKTSDQPVLALGPDRLPWILLKAGHSLGTVLEGKLHWQDLGEGCAPAQICSDDKLLYVRLEGRSSILFIEPGLRETLKENLAREEKKADLSLKEELRKLKVKESTSRTSSSSSSSSSTPEPSVETKEDTPATDSTTTEVTASPDPDTGLWSSTTTIDFKHILEGHTYGLDNGDGQFRKGATEEWIEHWVAEALHEPTAWGPTASRSSKRWIYYREFKDVIGRAMGGGQWWPTKRMQLVLDENWGKPYVVSAYPVLGLPWNLKYE